MKLNFGLIVGTLVSATVLAQDVTNAPLPAPLEMPAPVTEPAAAQPPQTPALAAPAKAPAKKAAAKKAAARKPFTEIKTTPLIAGPAVVTANHVNVRTRAGLSGEVVDRLTNGEPVTVIEEITLKHSGPEEPSAWAKIILPSEAKAWVKSSYIDPDSKTVTASKLNVRGGPGEAFGVIGRLEKGTPVTEIETKNGWTHIAPPAGGHAYVAAQYLSQDADVLVAAGLSLPGVTPEPPVAAVVNEAPTVAETPTEPVMPEPMTNSEAISNEMAEAMPPVETTNPPAEELPPQPRIVQREGIVRGNTSIQSPTKFELVSPDNHHLINYLYTTSTNLDLNRYKGLHIIVTGEEGLDERWKFTPIITIQRIQVLD